MSIALFLSEYVVWHYTKALANIAQLTKNFLVFGYHFFSIGLLTRTWISPWYRMREDHSRDLTDFESLGASIVANTILRIIGFLLRTVVIAMGIAFELCILAGAIFIFIVWLFFPVVVILLFGSGLRALF